MKKVILIACLLLGVNLYANLLVDGIEEYNKGNYEKAKELYIKACDGGDMRACQNLGLIYYNGDGVRQDKVKAKELFGKACDGGYMNGCKNYKTLNKAGI